VPYSRDVPSTRARCDDGFVGPSLPGTICAALACSDAWIRSEGVVVTASAYLETVARYARGLAEQGYPPGSLVLLGVGNLSEALLLSLAAWWTGHRVGFVDEADHRRRDRWAAHVGAALQICDADDIVDEEHLMHRDVPAVSPRELVAAASTWPARCRPSDTALVTWPAGRRGGAEATHAELIAVAADALAAVAPAGDDAVGDRAGGAAVGRRAVAVTAGATGEILVRSAAVALLDNALLDLGG
jgi:hypothetical protein